MESSIHAELHNILLDICRFQSCSKCSLSIVSGPDRYRCMAVEIENGLGTPEYFKRVWKAYNAIYPDKAAIVSDEVKELLGVKPETRINVTEEDMMNLFS